MKKYLWVILVFVNATVSICQTVEYGIGLGLDSYFFNHQNKERFENDLLKPTASVAGSIQLYAHLASKHHFQLRANLHLALKPIALSNTYKDANNTSITQSVIYSFYSADLSLLGLYKIDFKKHRLLPALGIFYSANKFLDITFDDSRTTFRPFGAKPVNVTSSLFTPTIAVTNGGKAHSVGINAGCFWQLKQSRWEVFTMAYVSPTYFFSERLEYKSVNTIGYLQGRFHYFIVGANFRLSKRKG
ncbi:MAG: hypothetical protein JNL70_24905 [Saprospiraceae bacterium]|nr:hypothetical protein [Saprospiraceae bacterium]